MHIQFVGWLIEFCVEKSSANFGMCVVLTQKLYGVDYNFSATFFCLALSYFLFNLMLSYYYRIIICYYSYEYSTYNLKTTLLYIYHIEISKGQDKIHNQQHKRCFFSRKIRIHNLLGLLGGKLTPDAHLFPFVASNLVQSLNSFWHGSSLQLYTLNRSSLLHLTPDSVQIYFKTQTFYIVIDSGF